MRCTKDKPKLQTGELDESRYPQSGVKTDTHTLVRTYVRTYTSTKKAFLKVAAAGGGQSTFLFLHSFSFPMAFLLSFNNIYKKKVPQRLSFFSFSPDGRTDGRL